MHAAIGQQSEKMQPVPAGFGKGFLQDTGLVVSSPSTIALLMRVRSW